MQGDDHLDTGRAALAEGRWEDARAAFAASLERRETPEALEGLGRTQWWLCEARESAASRERAFVLFRRAAAHDQACAVAVDLVITYLVNLGNAPAARGWLARAERVSQQAQGDPMRGWLWLLDAYLAEDAERSRDLLHRAIDWARDRGDLDLELVALADLGVNLVARGQVADGMALLDEAMAGSMAGECSQLEPVVYNCCSMLSACHLAGDMARATQWCRVADEFMRRYTSPFLFARCRVHYGSLLLAKGQWERAEEELRAALDMADETGPAPKAAALAALAELRLRQGRLEEAKELLAGCDETGAAAGAAAELRLAQRRPGAAVELLERRLPHVSESSTEMGEALALLADAHVGCGELDKAEEAAARLDTLARTDAGREAAALAAFARARVQVARGELDEAIDQLDQACDAFSSMELPFEGARARLELARALAGRRSAIAAEEARAALRAFERIGATACADEAASLLRSLGQRIGTGPRDPGLLTRREREVLRLVGLGLSNPQIAERLFISRKTAAHHVSNVLAKLNLSTRAELAAYATRLQIDGGAECAPV